MILTNISNGRSIIKESSNEGARPIPHYKFPTPDRLVLEFKSIHDNEWRSAFHDLEKQHRFQEDVITELLGTIAKVIIVINYCIQLHQEKSISNWCRSTEYKLYKYPYLYNARVVHFPNKQYTKQYFVFILQIIMFIHNVCKD